jgi:hypothetical protein
MMLAASPGTSITVEATGKEAAEVIEALTSDRLALRRRRLIRPRSIYAGRESAE